MLMKVIKEKLKLMFVFLKKWLKYVDSIEVNIGW